MNKPEINSDEYKKWCEDQITDYFDKPITDDVTDDQAEAIEYLIGMKKQLNLNKRPNGQKVEIT